MSSPDNPEIDFEPAEASLVAEMLTNSSAGVALSLNGISEHGAHFGGALIVPANATSEHVAGLVAAMATRVLGGIIHGEPGT